jgi:flagellin-specific chaperone FliS
MVFQSNTSQCSERTDHGEMVCGPAILADKGLFLLLLYDKAISCMNEALELSDALDKNTGEVAYNLERLYQYVYSRLISGNNLLDREAIVEARTVMSELYDAWRSIINGEDSAAVSSRTVADAVATSGVSWSPAA